MNSTIITIDKINELRSNYLVPVLDILLISLNRYGIKMNIKDKRIRFRLKMLGSEEIYYLAVCVNTFESPFTVDEKQRLLLNGQMVGQILDIEKDTCDTTYFRRNKTTLTLNSNMRSMCHGCTFCGTYNLDPDDRVDMSDENKVSAFLTEFLKENNMDSLEDLLRVTVCTGCFNDERNLVEHLVMVNKVFQEFGFNKRIRYIGSQIRTDEAMDYLQSELPYFSLSLTVECFSNREQRMRKEKSSLDMQGIKSILEKSKNHGFSTNYLYIVGLDELEIMKDGIAKLAPYINRMPIYQIMQNYVEEHENQRVDAAKKLEYYLEARKIIENQYKNTDLKPRSWENYRSLFYSTYQEQPYNCIRI